MACEILGKIDPKKKDCVLGCDLGGTNLTIALAQTSKHKPKPKLIYRFQTKDLKGIDQALEEVICDIREKHGLIAKSCCIAAAGPVSNDRKTVKLTNLGWTINVEKILEKTSIKRISLLNDFDALGYGLNTLEPGDLMHIMGPRQRRWGEGYVKAVIGAGTGLGKNIAYWDKESKSYASLSSEGGNVDFCPHNLWELRLSEYVKEKRDIKLPLVYEELVSGRGIEAIYDYLKTKDPSMMQKDNPLEMDISKTAEEIAKNRLRDPTSKKTMELFTQYLARCAKNLALDTLPMGGIYIAGGIAMKNPKMIKSINFKNEFKAAARYGKTLADIPVYLIKNYDLSAYGACYFAYYQNKSNKRAK